MRRFAFVFALLLTSAGLTHLRTFPQLPGEPSQHCGRIVGCIWEPGA